MLGTAVVCSLDRDVTCHCTTLQQCIHAPSRPWLFGFAYNLELSEMVLVRLSGACLLVVGSSARLLGVYPGTKLLGHRLYECSILRKKCQTVFRL